MNARTLYSTDRYLTCDSIYIYLIILMPPSAWSLSVFRVLVSIDLLCSLVSLFSASLRCSNIGLGAHIIYIIVCCFVLSQQNIVRVYLSRNCCMSKPYVGPKQAQASIVSFTTPWLWSTDHNPKALVKRKAPILGML